MVYYRSAKLLLSFALNATLCSLFAWIRRKVHRAVHVLRNRFETPCLTRLSLPRRGHQALITSVFYGVFNAFFYGCLPILFHSRECWRRFWRHFFSLLEWVLFACSCKVCGHHLMVMLQCCCHVMTKPLGDNLHSESSATNIIGCRQSKAAKRVWENRHTRPLQGLCVVLRLCGRRDGDWSSTSVAGGDRRVHARMLGDRSRALVYCSRYRRCGAVPIRRTQHARAHS